MSNEITMTSVDIELSDESLEAVAGGVDILQEKARFQAQFTAANSVTQADGHGAGTATQFVNQSAASDAAKQLILGAPIK